jgi:carbon monoxide dehydrogenase subunit G
VELVNEFRVPVSVDQAWEALTDVERIAPCIPGAQLLTVDGDDFTGAVKVKVGPITVQYRGNASAVVTAELKDEGDSTSCVLTTDLTISGKAAQFGRGVLSDVATKLIGQFAERLEADVLAGATASAGAETPQAQTVSAATQPHDVASVDLLSVVAAPVAKRVLPVAGGLAVGVAIGFRLGRRRS